MDDDDFEKKLDALLIDSDLDEDLCSESEEERKVEEEEDSSSDESTETEESPKAEEWRHDIKDLNDFPFADCDAGYNNIIDTAKTPLDYYMLFVKNILDILIIETNRYGKKKKCNWTDTNPEEMYIFLGLCIKMGIVKLPKLRDYWNQKGIFADQPICGKWMIRNRFELEIQGEDAKVATRNTQKLLLLLLQKTKPEKSQPGAPIVKSIIVCHASPVYIRNVINCIF